MVGFRITQFGFMKTRVVCYEIKAELSSERGFDLRKPKTRLGCTKTNKAWKTKTRFDSESQQTSRDELVEKYAGSPVPDDTVGVYVVYAGNYILGRTAKYLGWSVTVVTKIREKYRTDWKK